MDENISPPDRFHRIIDVMLRNMRLHHRIVEKRIECIGVHHSQHRMLMHLADMGKTASQKDIAVDMDVSPACVARMLKSLTLSGLVIRAEGIQDGRCNEVSISPSGMEVVEQSLQIFQRINCDTFADFSDDELEQFFSFLQRMQTNLSRMEQSESKNEGSEN